MDDNKMPAPVAWRCSWHKRGQVVWVQYHDEIDPLPATWDAPPNETIPLYSAEAVQALQAEVERLRAERDVLAKDAARYRWIAADHSLAWEEEIDAAMAEGAMKEQER